MIVSGAGLGLRPGELFGLTTDRIEFLKRTVRVDQQLVQARGEGVHLTPKLKTRAAYRTLLLPDSVGRPCRAAAPVVTILSSGDTNQVEAQLKRLERLVPALAARIAEHPPQSELGLVFRNERKAPIQQNPFAMLFTNAIDKANLPGWATPHDLRHFYASMPIRSDSSLRVIQTRLGHESAKTRSTSTAICARARRTAPGQLSTTFSMRRVGILWGMTVLTRLTAARRLDVVVEHGLMGDRR